MKNKISYFKHFIDAQNKGEIQQLILKEGMRGYGIYWALLEELSRRELPQAPWAYLTVWCKKMRVQVGSLERIIRDFNLFDVKEEGFCSYELMDQLEARLKAIERGKLRNSTKNDSPLKNTPTNNQNNSDLGVTNADACLSSSSSSINILNSNEERKNKNTPPTEQPNLASEYPALQPIKTLDVLLEEMLNADYYMENVALHSGMGQLFLEKKERIVELFKSHICLQGKQNSLFSEQDIRSYFTNFSRMGSITIRQVKRILEVEQRDGHQLTLQDTAEMAEVYEVKEKPGSVPIVPEEEDPYRFEQRDEEGNRYYSNRIIPPEAPPRPSQYSIWHIKLNKWTY